jgi:hypothetical protein
MGRLMVFALIVAAGPAFAADPCVIVQHSEKLKGMARWTAAPQMRYRPFGYVTGDFPKGMKFQSALRDSDINKIRQKGGRVIILVPNYTSSDLDEAKKSCAMPATNDMPLLH